MASATSTLQGLRNVSRIGSRRAATARKNGSLGGLKTAAVHSPEFLKARASKAGTSTRNKYGSEYYRFLRTLVNKKPTSRKTITNELIGSEEVSTVELIKAVTSKLGLSNVNA